MPRVIINFADDLGPSAITVDDMPDEQLADIQNKWKQEFGGSSTVLIVAGTVPGGTIVTGIAIKVGSITSIDLDD